MQVYALAIFDYKYTTHLIIMQVLFPEKFRGIVLKMLKILNNYMRLPKEEIGLKKRLHIIHW